MSLKALVEQSRHQPEFTYSTDDIELALAKVAGVEGTSIEVWRAIGARDRIIDLDALFARLDLHWLETQRGRDAKLIPLARGARGWKTLLTR